MKLYGVTRSQAHVPRDRLADGQSGGEPVVARKQAEIPSPAMVRLAMADRRKELRSLERLQTKRVMGEHAVPFAEQGRSVFCRFTLSIDPAARIADEVLVTDEDDRLLAVGRLRLLAEEVGHFERGIAVQVRSGFAADSATQSEEQ